MALEIRPDGIVKVMADIHTKEIADLSSIIVGPVLTQRVAGGYGLIYNEQGGKLGLPLNEGATSLMEQSGSTERVKGIAILLDREDMEKVIKESPLGKLFNTVSSESFQEDFPLVRIHLDLFEKFLHRYNALWNVDCELKSDEAVSGSRMTVDELMDKVASHAGSSEYVFVFSECKNPDQIANQVGIDDAPILHDEKDLDKYIVRCSNWGQDFLYFACSPEDASNGTSLTLCPVVEKEEA